MLNKRRGNRLKGLIDGPWRKLGLLLVAIGLVILALELTNITHLFHKAPSTTTIVTVGDPVELPEAADDEVVQPPAEKTPETHSGSSAAGAGAVDTGGTEAPSTPDNQWVVSDSGLITVKTPAANAVLSDGSTVAGSTKVNEIHYRLIDNKVGVLAQGTLSVVDGNFSGTLHFQPKGTGGRLDIFSTDAEGVEYNEVQINVRF